MRRASLAALAVAVLALGACGYSDPYANQGARAGTSANGTPSPAAAGSCLDAGGHQAVRFPDGLQEIDLVTGTGHTIATGDSVEVLYTGWLASNCTEFDGSDKHGNTPFPVTVGQGQVIKGWEEGLPGMKVGGKRKLIIPPVLGYGASGQPPTIPANATLVFDITAVSAGPAPSPSPSTSPKPTPTT